MLIRKILFFCLLISAQYAKTQNEGNIWYFGSNAGLDFNSGAPIPLTDGMLNTAEGCATISDNNGNLLFYTDGMSVYNRNHILMPNGTGLLGNNSSTQSAIIVKKPASPTIYYIFTVDGASGFLGGLHYSEVDMSLAGGFGDVNGNKNIQLFPAACEKVTAILHQNSADFWIVSRLENSNTYHSYLLTSSGLNAVPVVSNIGAVLNGTGGYLRGSPDGSKIAAVFCWNNVAVELYDFDNSTGILSNLVSLNTTEYEYGVEFSPNGELLYTTAEISGKISQFNLLAGSPIDIVNSETILGTAIVNGHALQLAPDGKIYIASWGSTFLSVINNPNIVGVGCNFNQFGPDLTIGGTHPGSSMAGLPTFYSSIFMTNSIDVNNFCLGDTTYFSATNTFVDSVLWHFGDLTSGLNNNSTDTNTYHIFSDTGSFNITLYSYLDNLIDTSISSIYINPNPHIELGEDTSICNGDILFLDAQMQEGVSYLWNDNSTFSTYTLSSAGLYFVELTDSNGCINSDSIHVLLNPLPYINLGGDVELCEGESSIITAPDAAAYLWSNNSTAANYEATSSGSYFVIITDSNGCVNSDTINVIVNPSPNSNFEFTPQEASLNNPTIYFSHSPSFNANVSWNLGDQTTQENLYDFSHTYQLPGIYDVSLIAVNEFGCIDSTIYQIIISPATFTLFVPSSFTPNNDEHNDVFVIKGNDIIEFNIKIFSRWGTMLFESNKIEKSWDGTYNGGFAQQDKYTYLITVSDLNGDDHRFPGIVTLIK